MSPHIWCDQTGGREAVARISAARRNLPAAGMGLARKIVMAVKRGALGNLTGKKAHLLRVQLARYASAQPIHAEKDSVSWGLPSGGMDAPEGSGRPLPMSAIGLLHERGGTIRPTGENKMLRIPLPPAMTETGLDRYQGMDFHQRMPWDAGTRWFIAGKGGEREHPVICRATGGKHPIVEAMYLLIFEAHVREKWWMKGAVDEAKGEFPGLAQESLAVLMEKGEE